MGQKQEYASKSIYPYLYYKLHKEFYWFRHYFVDTLNLIVEINYFASITRNIRKKKHLNHIKAKEKCEYIFYYGPTAKL